MITPLRLAFLGFILSLTVASLQAQCVPDSLVNSTPGGLYPPNLIPATGCNYYEEIITFKLPQDTTAVFAGQTITVNFNYFTVDSITGLPQGMDWECNLLPDCRYVVHPDSSNLDTVGCVTLFGTPTIPATYNVTVHLTANVDLFGNPSPNPTTLSRPLQVTPCEFEGDCYNLALSDNCAPTTLDITNNIPRNGKPGFTYDWDVSGPGGFSYQTSDENPFSQTLPEGGDYVVDFSVDIDTIGFILQNLTITQVGCSDLGGAPDLYWTLTNPNQQVIINTIANPVSNATLPLDMGITNLPLDTGQWRIQVWDDELLGAPTGCATGGSNSGAALFFTVPPAQTGTFTLVSGDLAIEFTIDNPIQTISCSDTIRVNAPPSIPGILRDGMSLTSDSSFFCAGGSTVLSTNSSDSLIWFLDGSPISGINDSQLVVNEAGLYSVDAIDRSTFCRSSSAAIQIDSVVVLTPMVSYDAPTETYSIDNPNDSVTYRWYEAGGAAVSDGETFAPASNGDYVAVAVDTATGCESAPTNILSFTSGIASINSLQSWSIFPNPTRGQLTVEAYLSQVAPVSLRLYDLAGRQHWQQELGMKAGQMTQVVQLSDLPAGMYLMELQVGTERQLTRLVIR